MGTIFMAFSVASVFGVPFSLYLANLYSWHAPFIFIAILGVPVIALIIRFLPAMQSHIEDRGENSGRYKPDVGKVIKDMFNNKGQLNALLLSGFLMMGHFLIIPFINPYMEFNKGYTKGQIPMVYLVGGIASLLSAIYLGRVSDNLGKFKVFTFSVLSSLIMVIGITNMPVLPFSLVLVFFAIWFVFATGRGVTAQAMVTNVVEKEQQGSFMVLNSSMQHAGTFLASIISGYIVIETKTGRIERYEWVGYLSIVVLLGCFLLGRYLFRHMDKKEPQGVIASQE